MLSENSWAQLHQNQRHPSDTNSFDFGLGCPMARSRPPHPTFPSSQALAVLGRGQTCRRLRRPFPPGAPLREAHGTTGEEKKRFDGEEDHVQSRRHYGKRRHSKVSDMQTPKRFYMQGRHSGKSYDCFSIRIQCAKVTAASGHISSTFFVLASNSVNIVAITLLVLLVGTIMFLAIKPYVRRPCNTLGKCGGATGMFVSP